MVLDEEPQLPASAVLFAAMTATVLASVFAHGVSARPLTRAYGRYMKDAEAGEAEMLPAMEIPVRGSLASDPDR